MEGRDDPLWRILFGIWGKRLELGGFLETELRMQWRRLASIMLNGARWISGNLSSPSTAMDAVEEPRKHHAFLSIKSSKKRRVWQKLDSNPRRAVPSPTPSEAPWTTQPF
ncbi:hypothetical protein POM88_047451 [Heracleum sosnowskyi]|uniref:Uncharacterized protein n=1 Tax=Heracleum sosnowskyi TaxID=360622 RepID=A0AAD8LXK7_9APIA|nr:hypothetical protein POM88_047451 [Heracleum sosnowskyi]